MPHTISSSSPNDDGGISSIAWESYITSNLYDKLKSENITLTGTAHLPTLEVAYGLNKGSLEVWVAGLTSTSSQYWLYSDGTIWGGVGTLGVTPASPFTQIHLQRDIIKYNYTVQENGETSITVPYDFSSVVIFINGVLQSDSTNAFTINERVISFSSVLNQGDNIQFFFDNVPISSVDYALKSDLSLYCTLEELSSTNGTSIIGIPNSGTLQDTIPEFFIDAFGADPTGNEDSTDAIKLAIQSATNGIVVSNFSKTQKTYAKVVFGSGQYKANNIPIVSGVELCGQGDFATMVFPSDEDSYVFTTVGTTASSSDPEQRMAGAKIRNMTVGCGLWTEDFQLRPNNTGGIYIKSGTYCLLENLKICRLDGPGLQLEGMWDSDFVNIKITNTGIGTTLSNVKPGLYIGNAVSDSVTDPSNALRFRGLQLENNIQNFYLDINTRHVTFDSPKIETSEATTLLPSIINGVRAISFNSAELTWQYKDQPMIRILNDQPHFGVSFNNPRPVSSTVTMGWYFDHLSTQMPLAINDIDGFAIWKLVTGRNVKIQGGEIMNCGPCIIDLTSDVYIKDFNAIVSIPTVAGDGTDDVIRVNGDNVSIEGVNLYCAGTATDGSAALYIGSSCINPLIINNKFRGVKNYGIRIISGATISANMLCDNVSSSTYGSLIIGYSRRYSVTSKNTNSGFGDGNVNAVTSTISAGTSVTLSMIAGGTNILIKTVTSSDNITAGNFFADYQSTGLQLISTINGIKIDDGTGVVNDGFIYVSKSGTNFVIKNYTTSSLTCYTTFISAQA